MRTGGRVTISKKKKIIRSRKKEQNNIPTDNEYLSEKHACKED